QKRCAIDPRCLRDAPPSSETPTVMFTLNKYKPEPLHTVFACSGFTVRQITRLSYEFELQGRGDLSIALFHYWKLGCTFPSENGEESGGVDTIFLPSPLGRPESYQVNPGVNEDAYGTKKSQFNYCRFSVETYGENFHYDLGSLGPKFVSTVDFPEGIYTGNRTL
ncbi:hypothetical protein PMAYCL1PPCAC_02680, partial [Pristionchus mayeri]